MASIITIITAEDVRRLVPGAAASLDAGTINPYLRPAHKAVASTVGIEVFNEIAGKKEAPILEMLQAAVANRMMYDQIIFDSIQKRQIQQVDIYRYELEAMQNSYLSYYFDALDNVFGELSESPENIKAWKNSSVCQARESLFIKTTDEFQSFYGIDHSHYFFYSAIFLQRTVMDKYLTPFDIDKLSDGLLRRLKSVIARLTVAYALRQFDMTMLPKSLRNSSSDGPSRSGASEQDAIYQLSSYLFGESEKDLAAITFEINTPEPGENIPSSTNLNAPENKFFLLG